MKGIVDREDGFRMEPGIVSSVHWKKREVFTKSIEVPRFNIWPFMLPSPF